MSREKLIRYGGPAAVAGGALYLAVFAATVLVNNVFAEEVEGTILGLHATIHVLDVATFALLLVGAVAVYLRQFGRLGRAAKRASS